MVEQPLLCQGRMPDWLRNRKGLYALDTFNEDMCLFRSIAVHNVTKSNRCTEKAEELAKQFIGANDSRYTVFFHPCKLAILAASVGTVANTMPGSLEDLGRLISGLSNHSYGNNDFVYTRRLWPICHAK